jgi:Flp pilus assembly pilin Flp
LRRIPWVFALNKESLSDTKTHPSSIFFYYLGWQKLLSADFLFQKGDSMFTLFKRFIREDDGQDFAEYALILGAIGVVAIAVIARYRNELIAAFEAGIEALRMARGG